MQVLGNMVMAVLVKYWIYICGGMFFVVTFEGTTKTVVTDGITKTIGTTVIYKVFYMMMFLSCVALYQVPKHTGDMTISDFYLELNKVCSLMYHHQLK